MSWHVQFVELKLLICRQSLTARITMEATKKVAEKQEVQETEQEAGESSDTVAMPPPQVSWSLLRLFQFSCRKSRDLRSKN